MFSFRPATSADLATLVEFNRCLARETEDRELDQATLTAGVTRLLSEPARGRYFVAELAGEVCGQLLITYEWSDWRNGCIAWLQSIYVRPAQRRLGVLRGLLDFARQALATDPDHIGLRLYVEHHNAAAQASYRRLGFVNAGYELMEQLAPRGERPAPRT